MKLPRFFTYPLINCYNIVRATKYNSDKIPIKKIKQSQINEKFEILKGIQYIGNLEIDYPSRFERKNIDEPEFQLYHSDLESEDRFFVHYEDKTSIKQKINVQVFSFEPTIGIERIHLFHLTAKEGLDKPFASLCINLESTLKNKDNTLLYYENKKDQLQNRISFSTESPDKTTREHIEAKYIEHDNEMWILIVGFSEDKTVNKTLLIQKDNSIEYVRSFINKTLSSVNVVE